MRALFTSAMTVLSVLSLSAQAPAPVRKDTMHLTVQTSISSTEVAAGQKVTLSLAITPKRDMHVYAPGKHDYQVIAVKIDPQPWLKAAPTTYPPSEIYHFKELDEKFRKPDFNPEGAPAGEGEAGAGGRGQGGGPGGADDGAEPGHGHHGSGGLAGLQ